MRTRVSRDHRSARCDGAHLNDLCRSRLAPRSLSTTAITPRASTASTTAIPTIPIGIATSRAAGIRTTTPGYWRPTRELRLRQACCRPAYYALPPYYQAWGYPRGVYAQKGWKHQRYARRYHRNW